jgi:hypothetical protein
MISSLKTTRQRAVYSSPVKNERAKFSARNPSVGITVREVVPLTAEQIYGCSFWLINYHLP